MTPPEEVKSSCAEFRCDEYMGDRQCPEDAHSTRQFPDKAVNVVTSAWEGQGNTMFDETGNSVVCEEQHSCTECTKILGIWFCLPVLGSEFEPSVSAAVLEATGNPCTVW
jgi:hypothetical protein